MRIVNPTDELEKRFGYAKAVEMICKAGFEGIDYTMCAERLPVYDGDYKQVVKEMLSVADAYGVPFVQSHGPYGRHQLSDTAARERFFERGRRALEVSAMLGSKVMVLHPMRVMIGNHKDQLKINVDEISKLIPFAKELGVKIAIENMCLTRPGEGNTKVKHVCKSAEELSEYIDAFGDDIITGCVDTGHAAVSGEIPAEFVRILGKKRLGALHIQDSDGVRDMHTLPFMSTVDFEDFTQALADIDYEGDITMEAESFMSTMPGEIAYPALLFTKEVAAYLRDRVEEKKRVLKEKDGKVIRV